jgi:hypothetical protein
VISLIFWKTGKEKKKRRRRVNMKNRKHLKGIFYQNEDNIGSHFAGELKAWEVIGK